MMNENRGMPARLLAGFLALASILVLAATPALADRHWHHRGPWDRHYHPGWVRYYDGPYVYYAPPPVYYGPPPGYYAPPVYYAPPPPVYYGAPSLNVVIPIR